MLISILSRDARLYSTRRLVEAARRRNHRVDVVNPLDLRVELGEVYGPLHRELGALVPRIGASITEYGCAILRQLEQRGHWSLNPSYGITNSRDKLTSLQIMQGEGIPVPRTTVVNSYPHLAPAVQAVGGLPVVLKIRRGTQGRGVVLVRTMAAARRAYEVMNEFQPSILVQEFVEEAKNRDLRVIVLGKRAIASMERSAPPGDFRANLHRGGRAYAVELDPDILKLAIKASLAHDLRFSGVDLIRTRNGYAIIEVNSSPGLRGIETSTRVPVAEKVVAFVESLQEMPVKA